jgi:ribonuclease D
MNFVSRPEALRELARELGGVAGIGIDTESDSFHSYREKTCLVQISTRDEDYIVDPLALPDLSPLGSVLSDPSVLKVFHAADNDVAGLRRDLGLETRNIFDTMIAARILGLPRVGLGDLLSEHFGVQSNKRMQRYAWGSRPLDPAALAYAAMDSRHLLPLCDILRDQLATADRLDEAEEEFARAEGATSTPRMFDPESFWRIKGSNSLQPGHRAILRELHIWRDLQASAADRPAFRVASDAVLVALASAAPSDLDSLRRTEGVPPIIVQRWSHGILAAIRRGASAPPPRPPVARRRDEALVARYEALRAWRRKAALERGVDPDVVVSNASLLALATSAPQTLEELERVGALGPWKLRTYGAALLQALLEIPLSAEAG